jgi:hypothetical protein
MGVQITRKARGIVQVDLNSYTVGASYFG